MERVVRSNILKAFLCVFVITFVIGISGLNRVNAADDPNPDEIELYFLSDRYKAGVGEIPSGYTTSYKINLDGIEGTPTYSSNQFISVIKVSADGVITPVANDRNSGLSVDLKVTCGNYEKTIKVTVKNYAIEYADKKTDAIISQSITDDMTEYKKVEEFCKWIGNNSDYSAGYTEYADLLILEKGDCWAAASLIVKMCQKVGINARLRFAGADPGNPYATHRNAAVRLDGKCYIVDAGMDGPRPRGYVISEIPDGFSFNGSTVYQYDGFDTDIYVPEKKGNTTITTFGNGKSSVLGIEGKVTLHIPKTITEIANYAFGNKSDVNIVVDPDNPVFTSVNGNLYSKDKTKLYYAHQSDSLSIDPATTEIMSYALANFDQKKIVIPGTVKKIGKYCFANSKVDSLIINEGVETIEEGAFYRCTTSKLVLPSSVRNMSPDAFYQSYIEEVHISGLTEIPASAFNQSKTKKIEIAEGTVKIGSYAFGACYALDSVSIPLSVTEIASNAFSGVSSCEIYYAGSQEDWDKIFTGTLSGYTTLHCQSVRVTGIDPNGDTDITLVRPGQFYQFNAIVLPSNASNQKINYKIDNDTVLSLNRNYVTAKAEGTCKVTATTEDGGFSTEFNVTVRFTKYKVKISNGTAALYWDYYNPDNEGNCEWKSELECYEGDKLILKPDDPDTGYQFSKWVLEGGDDETVFNPKYASNKKLTVTVPGRGITVKAEYSTVPVKSMVLQGYVFKLCPGNEFDVTVKFYPDNAFDKTVTWSSSNTSVAVVDSKGHVKTVAPGYTVITATAKDGSNARATFGLTVNAHELTFVEEKDPTRETEGNIEYYRCEKCGKLYSDAEGKHEISLADTVIPKITHDLTLIKAKEATCTEDGHKAYYECQDPDCGCKKIYSDKFGKNEIAPEDVVIPAGHKIEEVPAKDPTCTEDGYEKHYKCKGCDKLFSDAEGNSEISEPVNIPKLGHDKEHLKHYDAKAETYKEDGNIEYFECPRCGKYFKDEACENEIALKDTIIPKKGGAVIGEVAESDGLKYVVTVPYTDGRGTVTFIGVKNPVESLVIPATVEIKESTYKVNRIGTRAMFGDTDVKTVYIGTNVVIIDANAFFGCSSLVKVSGGAGLKTIGINAFARCPKLSTFVITSKVLYKIAPQAFYKDSRLKTVYVRNTTKLTKGGVKKSLKGSSVKTVKVKKSKVKKYKKYFTKKNCGRKVKVKK